MKTEFKMKINKVSWGIIGAGDVCEVKSAPAMQLIEGSQISAVMRRDSAKAQDYAKRHNISRWYDNADALIADETVNAIYIATPPHVHCEYTLKAAAAGKPVYVEKPMANRHDDCVKMIDACQQAGVSLFCAYYRRTLPHFLKVKSLLAQGVIGDVRHVEIRMCKPSEPKLVANSDEAWRINESIGRGGYFADLASHQLDALDFLLGPIVSANGISDNLEGRYESPDIVCATWQFESGITGVGSWCFTASDNSDRDETIIVGSKGEIRYPSFGKAEVELVCDGKRKLFEYELPKHIQHPLIEQVVGELLGTDKCVSTGKSAARTNRVLDWILG